MCKDCNVSRRTLLKTTLGVGTGLVLGASGLLVPDTTLAIGQPTIYTTGDWNARPPSQAIDVIGSRPNKILIHHTTWPNTSDFSKAHAFAMARSIQNHHMDTNGWRDTGQHFTISRGGYIMAGRHRSLPVAQNGVNHVIGAHCDGQNEVAVGIECEGLYTSAAPTDMLYNKLVNLCAWLCQQYGLGAGRIYGHRDFDATACPGDRLYNMLPRIRDDVRAKLA
jgi:hypothetical protein